MPEKIKPEKDRFLPDLITSLLQVRGFECDLNDVDVSEVQDFTGVFTVSFNRQFNGDISQWDTSSATCMKRMFENSEFNGDISRWNTSRVQNMAAMFRKSEFNGDISKWGVSNVETMNHTFELCALTSVVSSWNVAKVKSMFRMFVGSPFNGDISRWDVGACEEFGQMFLASKFTGDISRWSLPDTAQVPSVVEDEHLALFKEPNFYHWYVLSSKRAAEVAGVPDAWKEHGAAARAIGVDMGMPDHEIWHWAQKSWNEKKGLQLVLPEGLLVEPSPG